MKHSSIAAFLAAVAVPTAVLAMSGTDMSADNSLRYKDAPFATADAAGISVLTSEGIIQGNPDGTYMPNRTLNRAEFMKIVMPLDTEDGPATPEQNCFPDVRLSDWFWASVCEGKLKGIIQGNPDGLFHPERSVNYAEALKILVTIYNYDLPQPPANVRWAWYTQYLRAAEEHGVTLPGGIQPDTQLTRGQMARLTAGFLTESKGELAWYRDFERGIRRTSSSSSVSSSRSSSSSSSSSTSSSSSSSSSGPMDPLTDVTLRSQPILLGETSPILGSARFFIEEEPLFVTAVSVNMTLASPSTVQALLVYDDEGHYLGRATLNTSTSSTNRNYRLDLPVGALTVERRAEKKIYFRAQLASKDAGASTNQTVQIANVVVEGNGGWSNRGYTKQSASSDLFPAFLTARGKITSVVNALTGEAPLVTGQNQVLGSFTFNGRRTDSSSKILITDLEFQIEQTGGVTLSNVSIGTPGIPDRDTCTVTSQTISCTNIPESLGSLTDGPRTITVYGNSSATDQTHASLRLTLNQAGDITTDGSVTWTDGTSSYTWIGVDDPVASGTYYRY